MINKILDAVYPLKARFDRARLERRWARLRAAGLHLGQGVNLPASTWIDTSHSFLISIGDWCGFGEQCMILAHDGQMDEFLDAGLLAKVTIHESCHFGSRTVILPGVEIGPRTIVGANSVVSKSLPADTVCAGVPAKVICSLDEYLDRHRESLASGRQFPFAEYHSDALTAQRRQELLAALEHGPCYLAGGFSLELQGRGNTPRTGFDGTAKPHGVEYLKGRSKREETRR